MLTEVFNLSSAVCGMDVSGVFLMFWNTLSSPLPGFRFLSRRPPPLETPKGVSGAGNASNAAAAGVEGVSEEDLDGVDLQFELEHVHTELRNFLHKKRARKLMAGGYTGGLDGGLYAAGGPQEVRAHESLRREIS